MSRLKSWAGRIMEHLAVVRLAARDPRVPWYAKAVAVAVVAYLASPVDLIPDFIPVIGHLDDLLIVPLGIVLALRLIPDDVLADIREMAARRT